MKTNFIITKEYRRFSEFCSACKKENYIGLCYGPAGVGKSLSARQFARWNETQREFDLKEESPGEYTKPTINMNDFDTLLYTPDVSNTPKSIQSEIRSLSLDFSSLVEYSIYNGNNAPVREWRKDRVKLLIIDEADRLQPKSLEQVRDYYDREKIPVILIGMPGIEKRLIRFPQLYSRIGFLHVYKALSEKEVFFIIQNHLKSFSITIDKKDFSDHEAIVAFTRITQGNFRLINRLLKQVSRIMEINQLSSITKEVVEAARECLVIGNV